VSCYRIVLAEKARTPVSVACELLGVSTSGFYDWARRAPSDRALSDAWLIERIKAIHAENRGVYGSRRVTAELRLGEGVVVSRKRVQRLMRTAGLSGLQRVKRGRTTIRVPGVRVADDLVERRFRPAQADVLWVTDITYLRTWEGWVYLAAVQDAFSRRIVGCSMAEHMRAELVVDALEMAVHRRRPAPGLVCHSDHAQEGARASTLLADPPRADQRGLRVRRRLLQHHQTTLDAWVPIARPVREDLSHQHQQGDRLDPQAPSCPEDGVHSTRSAPVSCSMGTGQPRLRRRLPTRRGAAHAARARARAHYPPAQRTQQRLGGAPAMRRPCSSTASAQTGRMSSLAAARVTPP
jgi:putative transposase